MMGVRSICGVVLAAGNPRALADFYGAALGLRFEREDHGDLLEHFGTDIGEVHFGIHPPANLRRTDPGNASASIAFDVDSLEDFLERLAALGARQLAPPHDEGFGRVAAFEDPEGNKDRLFVFHRDVDKVRQRLLAGGN